MSPNSLLEQLERLSRRQLELTLSQLEPGEREQVRALLHAKQLREKSEPSFDTLVGLSPWVLKALDRGRSTQAGRAPLTAATRGALSAALDRIAASPSRNDLKREPRVGLSGFLPNRLLRQRAA